MKLKTLAIGLILCVLSLGQIHAATVYYQPTSYPLKKADGSSMPQDLKIVHLWDGWITNIYYGTQFVRDEKLQIGGWGDQYRTYIRFDTIGLPQNPDRAILWLSSYDPGNGSTPTPFAFCKVGGFWSLSMLWGNQPPMITCPGWFNPPTPGNLWGIDFTPWYNEWKSGSVANNGIMMFPQNTNNNSTRFWSSRTLSGARPGLQFDFTPTIDFKMPLPGSHLWLVTNEVGGYECKGVAPWPDIYHADSTGNYFSIDFSWRNIPDSGAATYSETSNIPILAVAGGKVYDAGYTSGNGNYVVIDHDGDMNLSTGFSTRYLHLKDNSIKVFTGQTVQQGAILGYMGNTGISTGTHLHFGVRYQNNGLSTTPELAKVVMDGRLLKGFQTECATNSSGVPTDWVKYYRSYNTSF